jgi:hypothetical protein
MSGSAMRDDLAFELPGLRKQYVLEVSDEEVGEWWRQRVARGHPVVRFPGRS